MKKAYLLGIGGAGMAGIAQVLKEQGVEVRGYDRAPSPTTLHLQKRGIGVAFTPNPAALATEDECIYSTAFDPNHPLLIKATRTLPTYTRGEMMARICNSAPTRLAVAGTHGKTTTTGMIAHLALQGGKDPTVLIGGHLPQIDGYGHKGEGSLSICEACEYKEAFLHLSPTLGILLNVDRDHLDCYTDMAGLTKGFARFLARCESCLVNGDDPRCFKAAATHPRVTTFGLQDGVELQAKSLKEQRGYFSFTPYLRGKELGRVTLNVPGKYQVYNALAALGAGLSLGIPLTECIQNLASFSGVGRRFQVVYQDHTLTVADDYAHHPTEIEGVLTTAKAMGYPRITAIFQPFTYSRTALLYKEFAKALSLADRVILAPLMAGREAPIEEVSSHLIAKELPKAVVCESLSHCAAVALTDAKPGELILTLGCGNVNLCALELKEFLQNRTKEE